ncbi:uncharacterized protein PGTG_05225 [Puccinia graminis f. sp. tritici CRL 75-36-700-3]|uniref:CxC1-like cysteine cluster associated with KDZ transposases domain-containing protein n=1 Tax=Puccinia graminis f. sp. tritici (strain CRL 75-36-700-3 / race SCCL) TaxID=418459 RepID=E3K790_PUCGT|nr:uncharacterized protein PGTG_05225 [Puccinia graminis f. sp. tritici CRL 75-36-700-3]EFP80000.2 hypothetical protein PGTG_05225 [Puccinia graminis f. sp. tritici CRL 75-36-700-3]
MVISIKVEKPLVSGTRAQRLRRMRKADQIAATQARFYGKQVDNQQNQHHHSVDSPMLGHDGFSEVDGTGTDGYETLLPEEPDDDLDWITLDEPAETDFDRAVHADKERWQQQAKEHNWNTIIEKLHAFYLDLKARTKNWTNSEACTDFSRCICPPHTLRKRMVDQVDLFAQYRVEVPFCRCTPDAIRLLQTGFLAASPVKPQTCFSLRLLIFHNSLWNHCHIGALPFTAALTEWLEPRSERLTVRHQKRVNMRKPFAAAVDLYRTLVNMTDKLVNQALRLTPQEILASKSCPACFGPQPPNIEEYPETTRNKLIICVDGNFQHRHQAKASRDYRQIETPRIFLPPTEISQMKDTIQAKELELKPPKKADRCADSHKAADDKRNESTWKGCDDTGLMGCCCRHDAAIYMGNIFKSGEQRHLPLALINWVIEECEQDRHIGVLYDLGCSLDKFIGALDYHPRFNDGWGLSDGEGLKRLWAYLSPLVSPLCYSTRNHRLGSLAHRLEYHNYRGIKGLPTWLHRKFCAAIKRREEARLVLSGLLEMRNPHISSGGNYTRAFFKKQWKAQGVFQKEHTEAEADRQAKLVSMYKQEVVVELLRNRLQGPEIFLATEQEVIDLLSSISEHSEKLKKLREELTGEHRMNNVGDDEESKLLLLLWDAKADLFVQVVHIQAEMRPITDSKSIGACLGTKLKEKIYKARQARRPAVKRYINTFNRCYQNYTTKFPDQTLSDAADYPLAYDDFVNFPLDHRFWNDGLYYHSKAPWAIDPEVRAGINATLTLSRVQEEFQLLAQELCRAIGWGVAHSKRLKETIGHISRRVSTLEIGDIKMPEDWIDAVPVGGFRRKLRYILIKKELDQQYKRHAAMMDEWSEKIDWLWQHCQPWSNRGYISEWNEMLEEIRRGCNGVGSTNHQGVDEQMEEAVLKVDLDDGEDADATLVSESAADHDTDGAEEEGRDN